MFEPCRVPRHAMAMIQAPTCILILSACSTLFRCSIDVLPVSSRENLVVCPISFLCAATLRCGQNNRRQLPWFSGRAHLPRHGLWTSRGPPGFLASKCHTATFLSVIHLGLLKRHRDGQMDGRGGTPGSS